MVVASVSGAAVVAPSRRLADDGSVDVAATAIAFTNEPAMSNTSTTIPTAIEYVDADGNRDTDVTGAAAGQITATLDAGGAESNNVVAAASGVVDFNGAGFQIADPGALNATMTYQDAGTAIAGNPALTTLNFDLISGDDADS